MKLLTLYLAITSMIVGGLPGNVQAQPTPIAKGVYRIPYDDGTQVRIAQDHITHTPVDAIDMTGINGNKPYRIVAAADGWVRYVEDGNQGSCFVKNVLSCSACNNYVWIEHPNGEWTKYTHFVQNSVSNIAGIVEGQYVCAGTFLGYEGDVGATSGSNGRAQFACSGNSSLQNQINSINTTRINNGQDSLRTFYHLHFEVAIPDDPSNPINPVGGFIKGKRLVSVFCGISGNIAKKGDTYTAGPCDEAACTNNLNLPNFSETSIRVVQVSNEITSGGSLYTVQNNAQVLHRAGKKVSLEPGFTAKTGAYYNAYIAQCNSMPGAYLNCNPVIGFGQSNSADEADRKPYYNLQQISGINMYPNPFTDLVNISFEVKEATFVELIFYDMYGKIVGTPVNNEYRDPGLYQFDFNGSALPEGTYIYHLRIGEQLTEGKLIKTR